MQAALSDLDNPPLTDEEMAAMRPAREVLPSLVGQEAAQALLNSHGRASLRDGT